MFSTQPEVSSKRVLGTLCILFFLVIVGFIVFGKNSIEDNPKDLVTLSAWIGAGLLGLGLADSIKLIK